jgi:hypothetical protein
VNVRSAVGSLKLMRPGETRRERPFANGRFEAPVSASRVTGFGRDEPDATPETRRSAQKILGHRQGSHVDPLLPATSDRFGLPVLCLVEKIDEVVFPDRGLGMGAMAPSGFGDGN